MPTKNTTALSDASELQLQLWTLIANVPEGKVTTYGKLATLVGAPNHARYVGSLLKKLPENTSLPWHRVVNASGKISFPVDSEAYQTQYQRLVDEGILFTSGRISLATFGWQP